MSYLSGSMGGNIMFVNGVNDAVKYIIENENEKSFLKTNECADPNDQDSYLRVFGAGVSIQEMAPLIDPTSKFVEWFFSDDMKDESYVERCALDDKDRDDREAMKIIRAINSDPDVVFARYSYLDRDWWRESDFLDILMSSGVNMFLICDNKETMDDIRHRAIKKVTYAKNGDNLKEEVYSSEELTAVLIKDSLTAMGVVDLRA